jgi:hypothetical protein
VLTIEVPIAESFDESTEEFVAETFRLDLEHSLSSLSKWEARFNKAFFRPEPKTADELLFYVTCMCLTQETPPEVFYKLSDDNVKAISDYINKSQAATVINQIQTSRAPRDVITAGIIYHWMFSLQIPIECQDWHLSRLFDVIMIHNAKNAPKKKQSRQEMLAERRRLNEQRKAEMKTRG